MVLTILCLARDCAPVAAGDVIPERERGVLVFRSAFEAVQLEYSEQGSYGHKAGSCDSYPWFDKGPDHG